MCCKVLNTAIYITINTLFALIENLNVPCLITPDVYGAFVKGFHDEKLYNDSSLQIQTTRLKINQTRGKF